MEFGIITGNVVCTVKDEKIQGRKLLLVQPVDDNLKPTSAPQVGIDSVGAGEGEVVLFVKGSSARMTDATENRPVDCTVMGIVDYIEKEGKVIFRKTK
ncbi:MAG: EutN/CcmL family microcompartment protein [Elusimicrobia bacterium]|nr:EutN/CcmL family microcompartment protein [Elusimicrobiota bacterium]